MLRRGAHVFSSDGEPVGEVVEVRADADADIFDGLVVGHGALATHKRLVGGDQVGDLHERGVVLKLDAAAFEALPAAP